MDTGHLAQAWLAKKFEKLDKPQVAVKIFHMKPQHLEEIRPGSGCYAISSQVSTGDEQFRF